MSRVVHTNIWSAYGYARKAGYEGTEDDFEQGLKKSAEAAENAEESASTASEAATEAEAARDAAAQSAESASTSEGNALEYANSAAQVLRDAQAVAQTVNAKANEAAGSASRAENYAQTATTKASEATAAAGTATAAATSASGSAQAADASATAAAASETNAAASASSASTSAGSASESADEAAESAAAAQAVKDSIPADYTALSDEVTDLKSQITQTTDSIGASAKYLRLIYAPTFDGAFHVINKTYNTSQAYYKHLEYTLQGERYLYITGNPYSNNYPLWAYLDADNNVISYQEYSGGNAYLVDVYSEVPPNAVKLIVNGASWNNHNNAIKTYDETIRTSIEGLAANRVICAIEDVGTKTAGAAKHIKGNDTSGSYFEYNTLDLNGGETLIISGYNFADNNPLFMIYAGTELIYKGNYGNAGIAVSGVQLTMPSEATKIIVNGFRSLNNYYPASIKMYGTESLADYYHRVKNRRYLFIGDSYGQGYSHDGSNSGWILYCAGYMGLATTDYVRKYKGGARFSANASDNTFEALLLNELYPQDYFTDIVVCGGYNDHSYAEDVVLTGIASFVAKAKLLYPNARIHIGCVAYNKAGNGDGAEPNWSAYRQQIETVTIPAYQKCVEYGAEYLTNAEYWLGESGLTPSDGYHPSEAGNRSIARAVANALLTGSAPLPYNEDLRLD